ncbi:MAG: DUF5702 domain-containing protein [bacterium]|nr:DUF5702 domain-containing protein [bacterium]
MVYKVQGSITVFLSFILAIILALIGTLLDVARVDMANSFSYRSLVSAVDTEFTKYCSELYEDYHIYMLGNGHSLDDVSGEEFLNSMTKYLMYSFDSDTDLTFLHTPVKVKGTELLNLSVDSCKVDGTTSLADYDGKIFEDQIAQYMKYYVAGDAADGILAKLNLLQQSKETMTVVRKKNEVDEKVAKIDKSIMKLMQEVEGITFKNNSLVVTKDYMIKIQNSFAKKFCTTKISPNNVGINHNVVWDSLKEQYINPVSKLNNIKASLNEYTESEPAIQEIQSQIDKLKGQIDELEHPVITPTPPAPTPIQASGPQSLVLPTSGAEQVTSTPIAVPTAAPGPSEEEVNKQIEDLKAKVKEKEAEKKNKEEQRKKLLPAVREEAGELYEQAEGVLIHTRQALREIDNVNTAKNESMSSINEFETTLKESKDKVDKDTYKGLQDDFKDTKDYVNQLDKNGCDTSVVGNVLNMKSTLSTNSTILDNTVKISEQAKYLPVDKVDEVKGLVDQLISQYDSYSIKSLHFDYSTLTVEENAKNPLTAFKSLVDGGLLELVVDDTSKLANTTLDSFSLVSKTVCKDTPDLNKDEQDNKQLADNLGKGDIKDSGISDSLKGYEANCESANVKDSKTNDIARKVLINEYGVTNFLNLMDDLNKDKSKDAKEQKATKIKYEQEYLAIGSYNEQDNVKSIVMRTIFMRTAVNYISLLTNSKCRTEAKETATALVGFTGLAPLVLLTSQLILIAWGFEESLVDTRALLDGKNVAFFKQANEFSVEYKDLLLINKETIKKKANKYKDNSKSPISLSYNDYLRIYMLMVPSDTLSYRMMDLIQENMRTRYDKQFQLLNGIFGTRVSLTVTMPGKFLTIPFIKKLSGYDGSSATIKVSTDYSY